MQAPKTRIKDIARLAGVSIGTVDRVLHDRIDVAEKTRIKIKKIIEETHYTPNILAKVLKLEKSFNIVTMIPEPTGDNVYWERHKKGINRALEDLSLFQLTVTQITFDLDDENDFRSKAEGVLNLNPDGVVLVPIHEDEALEFCSGLRELNIPLVYIDEYLDESEFLGYIGGDSYFSGRVAGNLVDQITSEIKDILILSIDRRHQNTSHLNRRSKGLMDYFEGTGRNKGKKIIQNIPRLSTDEIRAYLDQKLKEYPNLETICVTGSKAYLICKYLEERKIGSIKLVGFEINDNNKKYLRSGKINFIIGQRPAEQTAKAIKKLTEYLSQDIMPDKFEFLPIDIYTSENIDTQEKKYSL